MKRAHPVIAHVCLLLAGRCGAWIIGLAMVWMAAGPRPAWAQSSWPNYPNNSAISVTSSGNVGIGTTNPGYKFTVSSVGSGNGGQTDVQITGTGNVGGGINLISSDTGGKNWSILSTGSATGIPGSLGFYDTFVGAYRFVVSSAGNVGIGMTNPQYKLAVNGNIGAKDIIVTNTGWPDYVFRPGYRLRPLTEINAYIQEHRHLPDIPTEAEVKQKGVSLGEMQAKLLAKVEELTLHLIQQDKENRELREQMAKQEMQNRGLRERLARLEGAPSLIPHQP